MITLKYQKKAPAIFISHIDLLRAVVRIIRRTGYSPEFSKGFNPHMLLFFSPAIALGVQSECEYVTVDINGVAADDFLAAFNESAFDGIKATSAYYTEKSPNLAGTIVYADYFFPSENPACTAEIVRFFEKKPQYVIEFTQKKERVTKDVSGQIKYVKETEGGLIFGLATGNDNLRADRLLPALKKDFNLDTEVTNIIKIKQYMCVGKDVVEVDGILETGLKL